jgi:hypothetical protein
MLNHSRRQFCGVFPCTARLRLSSRCPVRCRRAYEVIEHCLGQFGSGHATRQDSQISSRCGNPVPRNDCFYCRSAVGDGEATVEESGEGASLRRTLFFAAGSDPKRARGVSRLGWMRETVWGPQAAPSRVGVSANTREAAARPQPWTPCRCSRQDSKPPHKSRNEFPPVARGRFIHRPGPLRIPAALVLEAYV